MDETYIPHDLSFASFSEAVNTYSSGFYSSGQVGNGCDSTSFICYAWGIGKCGSSELVNKPNVQTIETFNNSNNVMQLADLNQINVGDAFISGAGSFFVASVTHDEFGDVEQIITWESSKTTLSRVKNIMVFDASVPHVPNKTFGSYNSTYLTHEEGEDPIPQMPLEALTDRVSFDGRKHLRYLGPVEYTHNCSVPFDGEYCDICVLNAPLTAPTVSVDYTKLDCIGLSWNAISGATEYEIRTSAGELVNTVKITSGSTSTIYCDIPLPRHAGQTAYMIRAIDRVSDAVPISAEGERNNNLYQNYSRYSAYSSFTIDTTLTYPQMQPPVVNPLNSSATFSWSKVGVSSDYGITYTLERSTSLNGTYSTVCTVSGNNSASYSYTNYGLSATTIYYYRVFATNANQQVSRATSTMFQSDNKPIGDANLDGSIDSSDASSILRYVVRLDVYTPDQLSLADCNLDGTVNAADASAIQRFVVRLDTLPPRHAYLESPTKGSEFELPQANVFATYSMETDDVLCYTISI